MHMTDLIEKKKQGQTLTQEELHFIVHGYTAGDIPDYQMSALMMAIYFRGMTPEETAQLTIEMEHSGDVVDLSPLGEHTADKHSTGGVGDKTSLVLCPMVAACGGKMAKMSGRGLGHTGGTIDKLESFPGFSTAMTPEKFLENAENVGFVIAGQTANLAPADKKMYALRDVTATVDSIPLIVSSIMAKKLASGARTIVLDVKTGSGAFMETEESAFELARQMVSVGKHAGRNMAAVVTDMDQPLGFAVGNALEVMEAVDVLRGHGSDDLCEVCMALAENMLMLCNGWDEERARAEVAEAVASGKAFETMKKWIAAQGGNAAALEDFSLLPQASVHYKLKAPRSGYLAHMDAQKIGEASAILGAGRQKKEDSIDFAAGITMHKKLGDYVKAGESICTFYADDESLFAAAEEMYRGGLVIRDEPPTLPPLVYARVTSDGVERF